MPVTSDLCFQSATELVRRIATKDVSAHEVMEAHLAQVERLNPALNAIVTLDAEAALAAARAADALQARGEPLGALHGLPVAHKDVFLTRGMRTTFGSPIHRDFVPDVDSIVVERQRHAGAIAIGKTNVPEFAAGSQTFNTIFGATRNPYDPSKTCGGSSGGAAVALATGMVTLADGTDLGGSLRNPANFCNVVGLRPSIGRVPQWPVEDAWSALSVAGPMARSVADVALFLSVLAGPDDRDPLSIGGDGAQFRAPLDAGVAGTRVAWTPDLGGLPVEPGVRDALATQRHVFDDLGCIVDETAPDLHDADEVFRVQRAVHFASAFGELLEPRRADLKDTIVWNTELGLALTGAQVARAQRLRSQVFGRMHEFMTRYDVLVAPVNQVLPFPVDRPYPTEIDGVIMESYMDWMRSCYFITVTGHPSISVPCGFTPEGLPVGVQIVGRYRGELELLRFAHAFEAATGAGRRRPPDA